MNATKLIIGGLAAAVVALAIGLVVVMASDKNDDSSSYWNQSGSGPYYGMMSAMGNGNWDQVQAYMRQVLGDEGYQEMLDHMRNDGCDWSSGDPNIDDFMHDMMYGALYRALNNGATPTTNCW